MQFSFLGTLKVLDRCCYFVGNCYFIFTEIIPYFDL